MQLNEMGEFGLIRLIQNNKLSENPVIVGIGDDCAVLPLDEEHYQVVSCDLLMEGVHFFREKITPYQLGYKSVAVNLSDVAAMGGVPQYILISIALPKDYSVEEWEEFYRGVTDICKKYHTDIVGGDTTSSKNGIAINVTVAGKVEKKNLHLRKDACPGDVVFVTGNLGGSKAGLELLIRDNVDISEADRVQLLKYHVMPEPCVDEIRLLNEIAEDHLHALNDISDGLFSEASEIAEASGVACVLDKELVPIAEETKRLADILGQDALNWACTGGEDYQLVGTLAAHEADRIADLYQQRSGKPLHFVGKIREGKGVFLKDFDGIEQNVKVKGYNHFTGEES